MSNNIVRFFNIDDQVRYQPIAGNPWTPAVIATDAWYDASDSDTITIATGVSQWDDKSGNAYNFTQAIGSQQPSSGTRTINTLNTIDFNGSSHLLSRLTGPSPGSGDCMTFAVADIDSLTDAFIINGQNGDDVVFGLSNPFVSSNMRYYHGTSPAISVASTGISMFTGYQNGSTLACGVNGTYNTGGVAATVSTNSWYIGGYYNDFFGQYDYLNGAIGEIIIIHNYDLTLRQKVEGYLAHKWGLTANLPSDHPYKAEAPTV